MSEFSCDRVRFYQGKDKHFYMKMWDSTSTPHKEILMDFGDDEEAMKHAQELLKKEYGGIVMPPASKN